jgi:hypothetical protein
MLFSKPFAVTITCSTFQTTSANQSWGASHAHCWAIYKHGTTQREVCAYQTWTMLHEKSIFNNVFFIFFLSMCDIFMFVQLSNNTLFIYYIFTCTYMSIFTRTCVSHHALLLVKRKGWSLFPNWGGLNSFLTAAAMIPDWGGCNSSSVLLPHTSCLGCGSSTT